MKGIYRLGIIIYLFTCTQVVFAQQYLKGTFVDERGEWQVNYDRTQAAISKGTYRTTYKIMDATNHLINTIMVTNYQTKKQVSINVRNGIDKPFMRYIDYVSDSSGLIYCDLSNLDTAYNLKDSCTYLFSFTSVKRDYPILHRLILAYNSYLILDPITVLRQRKHNELIAPILAAMKPVAAVFTHARFTKRLMDEHKLLYYMDSLYTDSLSHIYSSMQRDSALLFKNLKGKKLHYVGNKLNGKPDGIGILIDKGNIYQGRFSNGQFDSGRVVINGGMYIYYGGYYNGNYYALGAVNYSGNHMQGTYVNGVQASGISWANDKTSELYFGGFAYGSRNGYGELRNTIGVYCGMFTNGKLTSGYARETDTFGYTTYSYIEGDNKTSTTEAEVMDFMDSVSPKK